MTTYTAKAGEIQHGWYVVDAQGKVLGRLAAQIAARLRGKHKPQYTPHVDTGDFIVVVNAAKLRVTGRKPERKMYYRHSGQPGQLKETTFAMLKKLKVYGGATHPHGAQQPKTLEIQ
jgi:large subunit ribosomal protein L13